MPGSGSDWRLGVGSELDTEDFLAGPFVPDQALASAAVAIDLFWGVAPPAVVTVDYTWLVQPLRMRPDPPTNDQAATTTNGVYARAIAAASVTAYGTYAGQQIQLDTINDGDAGAYASYTTTFYAAPRQRIPQITFDLLQLTDLQRQTILAVQLGQRITVANVPSTWPAGCNSMIVEGIAHVIGTDDRLVSWNTSPVIGASADTVGPWFRLGASFLNSGTDLVPF
jgi:hypothetical protein